MLFRSQFTFVFQPHNGERNERLIFFDTDYQNGPVDSTHLLLRSASSPDNSAANTENESISKLNKAKIRQIEQGC